MNLLRVHPRHELLDVHDEVNRLFDGAVALLPGSPGTTWLPPVDIHETESGFTLKMDVPGIKPEDIRIRLVDDTLTIEGERAGQAEENGTGRVHKIERVTGRFARRFTLRTPVNPAAIQAACRNGVLEVTLPRAAEAMPREIKVEGA
jgi:HSP20 family protein